MGREAGLWNWLRKYLPPGRYSRIESSTSPGIPDVSYTISGIRGWIELKDAQKSTAKQPFKRCGLRPDQINWFRDEITANGCTGLWILARVGKGIYMIHGTFFEEFNGMTQFELEKNASLFTTVNQFRNSYTQSRFRDLLEI